MEKYHKIQSVYKRDNKTFKFIDGAWSLDEFDYLKDNEWIFTEKVDGTNIRVHWESGLKLPAFGGRTDNAQIPVYLYDKLNELFTNERLAEHFPEGCTLYGEGYGAKIQKGGGNYNPNGVDFVLFDVKIGDWWLKRQDVADVADKLSIPCVPILGFGTLKEAIGMTEKGFNSDWGDFRAEGLVMRPKVELKSRNGHRIITKVKCKDFD